MSVPPFQFTPCFSPGDVRFVSSICFPGGASGEESENESRSVVSDSFRPHGLYSPWNSPDQSAGVGLEPAYKCRRHKKCGFDPWIRKIPWRRAWQPAPIFLPGESHWNRRLRAAVHGVTESQTRLEQRSSQAPSVTPLLFGWVSSFVPCFRASLPSLKNTLPSSKFPQAPEGIHLAFPQTPNPPAHLLVWRLRWQLPVPEVKCGALHVWLVSSCQQLQDIGALSFLAFPFYRWRNWGAEKLNPVPEVTQGGARGRAETGSVSPEAALTTAPRL